MTERYSKIIHYSFMLAILIVCLHCVHIIDPHFQNPSTEFGLAIHWFFSVFFYHITNLAVPSFFFLSAFLFYRNYTLDKTWIKFKSRIKSLLVPYIIWNVFSVLWLWVVCSIPFASQFMSGEAIKITLYNIIVDGIVLSKYNLLWFVGTLMLLHLLCPLFYIVFRHRVGGVIIAISLFVWPMFGNMNSVLGLSWNAPVFYSLGAFFGIHLQSMVLRNFKTVSCMALGFFCTLSIVHVLYCPDIAYDNYIKSFLSLTLFVSQVILMWIAWDFFHIPLNNPWYLGLSFFIYVIHRYVIKVVCHITMLLLGLFCFGSEANELLTYVVSIPLSLVLSVYIAKLWIKISPRSFALITGGRS